MIVAELMAESIKIVMEQLMLADVRNVFALLEFGWVEKELNKDFLEEARGK